MAALGKAAGRMLEVPGFSERQRPPWADTGSRLGTSGKDGDFLPEVGMLIPGPDGFQGCGS